MAQQKRTKQNGGLAGQGIAGTPTQPPRGNVGSQAARMIPSNGNVPQKRRTATPQQINTQQMPQGRSPQVQPSAPSVAVQQTRTNNQTQYNGVSKKEQKKIEKANKQRQKQMRKNIKAQSKQVKNTEKRPAKEGTIFQRIKLFFELNNIREIYNNILVWIDKHYIFPFLFGAIFIAIGLLFNRYISFAAAFTILAVGMLMSKKDLETGSYCCYGAAIMTFIIPYLF